MDKKKDLIREWMRKAEHDIGMARLAINYKPEFADSICFHCQQAAEKSLKAYLIFLGSEFKKTHNLSYLLDLIIEKDEEASRLYPHVELLEGYAVEIRYPDGWCEPTKEEMHEAFRIATEVQDYVTQRLK